MPRKQSSHSEEITPFKVIIDSMIPSSLLPFRLIHELPTDMISKGKIYFYCCKPALRKIPVYWDGKWRMKNAPLVFNRNEVKMTARRYEPYYYAHNWREREKREMFRIWIYKIEDLKLEKEYYATWCEKGLEYIENELLFLKDYLNDEEWNNIFKN